MRYIHTMVRVKSLEASLDFYCNKLGFIELGRYDSEKGQFTNVFLSAPRDKESAEKTRAPELELTYNWEPEDYSTGRAFGHLAYRVDDIYHTCQDLMNKGVIINRPPRDGYMAFIKSPDEVSIELLQKGKKLQPKDPWKNMKNVGTW